MIPKIKPNQQKKRVQNLILPLESKKMRLYYPNISRIPGRKTIIWLMQSLLYLICMFLIYDFMVNAMNIFE